MTTVFCLQKIIFDPGQRHIFSYIQCIQRNEKKHDHYEYSSNHAKLSNIVQFLYDLYITF